MFGGLVYGLELMGWIFFVDLRTGWGSDSFLVVKGFGVDVVLNSTDQILIMLLMVMSILFSIVVVVGIFVSIVIVVGIVVVIMMIIGTVLSFGGEGIHVMVFVLKMFLLVFVVLMGMSNILVTQFYVPVVL